MANKRLDIKALTADGYGRFYVIRNILDILYTGAQKPVSLLDVGGGSPYMTLALKNKTIKYDLTSIDIVPKPSDFHGKYVVGDATDMEFENGSFDASISTDVLEHVPDNKKIAFVRECLRVAREFVIISAPFDEPTVNEAEELTNGFNKTIFKHGQEWLEDHFKNHKPKLGGVVRFIEKSGYDYVVLGSNNVYLWTLSTHLNLIDAGLGVDHTRLLKLNSKQNTNILRSGDMRPPYYRQTIVVFKKGIDQSTKDKILELGQYDTDDGAVVEYLNETMSILADRIAELNRYNKKYIKQISILSNEKARQEYIYRQEIEKFNNFSVHNINLSIPLRKIVGVFRKSNLKEK